MSDARMRMLLSFGLCYLVVLAVIILPLVFGLGKIEEKTSFGLREMLPELMDALKVLSGGVLVYAFESANRVSRDEPSKESK